MTTTDPVTVARSYIETVGTHDLAPLNELFAESLSATFAGRRSDKTAWIAALNRLLPILIHNEITEVFVDNDRVCIVYDFVTNTEGGTIRCVELLTVSEGAITAIELILDRVAFAPVTAALSKLVAKG